MSEKLLQALSSVGTMGIDTFNASFSKLSQCSSTNNEEFDIKDIRYRTLRIMSALGHCDADFDRRFVSICNPSIVALPRSGHPKMVWCGARTSSLVEKLLRIQKSNHEEISVEIVNQKLNTNFSHDRLNSFFPLPDAIIIESLSEESIKKIIPELKIESFLLNSPVLQLINFSADVKELKMSISPIQTSEPNWVSRTFNNSQLKFERRKTDDEGSKLSSYISPINQQRLHIFWDQGKGYEIDRDWGRWLVLSEHEKNVICYDKRLQILAVPATLPLPILLARAVTFCSGRSPLTLTERENNSDIPFGHPLDAYLSVPFLVAEAIAKKLGQNLLFRRLGHPISGE
ncbi:MAG: hypothetical protein WC626_10885 [Methanoregula sp.]